MSIEAFNSAVETPANCAGAFTMCGVRNMSNSVLPSALLVDLKRFPNSGISPRKGTLETDSDLVLEIKPPITTVWPFGVITTVLGDSGRFLMARVSALSDKGKAHVVSSPRVLTLDNVEAVLENLNTFYVPVAGNLDVGLYNVSSGTSLRVTPLLITEAGRTQIKLAIRVEDGGITQQTVGNLPVIQRTTITTQAFINEGESVLIGGYKSDVHNDTKVGIPGLSAIPVLGALFRHQQKESSHVEHLFMLTPRVVER